MITQEQLIRGITSYYETEFCQRSSGLGKFTAYFMLPSVPQIIGSKLEEVRGTALVSGIMNDDGLIDLDVLRDRASDAMQHCSSLDIMGFRVNSDDINKLYDCIRRT